MPSRVTKASRGALALLLLAGCASVGETWRPEADAKPRVVSLSEFARPEAATGGVEEVAGAAPQDALDPAEAVELAKAISRMRDPDPALEVVAVKADGNYVVESLVGEVNGRPIYADQFLVAVQDRLLIIVRDYRNDPRQMRMLFRDRIAAWLKDVIESELILAEAEAALTEEQQMGLFAFLQGLQEEKIRQVGAGTRSLTEQFYQEHGEGGFEGYMESEKNKVLLSELYRRRILPRIIVSWRDVELAYQREHARFNPPRTVTLARILLRRGEQSERIALVTRQLAEGEPFAKVAQELGIRDGGRWDTFKLDDRGLAGLDLAESLTAALAGLKEGQTTPPVQIGGNTVWLHIVEFSDPPRHSIYDPDVQRWLTNTIRSERRQEQWKRFIDSLMAKGVYDELDAMSERLYKIALARYAPE